MSDIHTTVTFNLIFTPAAVSHKFGQEGKGGGGGEGEEGVERGSGRGQDVCYPQKLPGCSTTLKE